MTLNLMLINQSGVWQSSDFRLTDPRTSAVKDDFSVKHVAFRCRDGAALLMPATFHHVVGVTDSQLSFAAVGLIVLVLILGGGDWRAIFVISND
jgi:hypothetical protein